jgi:putative transposase
MSGQHDSDRHKIYTADSSYHIFNRGVDKKIIFHDDDDYRHFLGLIKRQLTEKPVFDKQNRQFYANFLGDIEVLAFALMPNHFHLLIHQASPDGIMRFMKSLLTSYSKYYNKKYKRVGPLFQGRYRAEKISVDETLAVVSRYIHRNPKQWEGSPFTSYDFYSGKRHADWLKPTRVLSQFNSFDAYLDFLKNFDPHSSENFFKF